MSIDIARELAVRSVAHNIAYRFGPAIGGTRQEISGHALRLAELYDPSEDGSQAIAVAAVAMFCAAAQEDTRHITMAGLAPEEDPPHD